MAFLKELEQLNYEALLAEFDEPRLRAYDEVGDMYFEEVAWELRQRDPTRAAAALLERYGGADATRAAAVLMALARDRERDVIHLPLLRAALERPEPDVVAEAIDSLSHLADTESSPRIEALLTSEHTRVRSAALRYLAATEHPDAVAILRAALDDEQGNVRANAVEELVELVGLPAEPWVLPLAEDPCELVRDTVRDALAMERENPSDRPQTDS